MQTNNDINGFLLINKPVNVSSYDCIRALKKILKTQFKTNRLMPKIGHTGTLDNFANGLLIIAIGRKATKEISSFMNLDKEYIFKAKIGELTDTLDKTGTITKTKEINIEENTLRKAIENSNGELIQIPPIYSALKHKGNNLYKLARKKMISEDELLSIIKTKQRNITVRNIELLKFEPPFFTVKTTVSKGTYIRSLANDIVNKLDNIATCYELKRTKIGGILLTESVKLENFLSIEDIVNNLIEIDVLKNKLIKN